LTRLNTPHIAGRFFLPDGKHFLYLALSHDPSRSANNAIYYASLDGGENRLLFRSQIKRWFAAQVPLARIEGLSHQAGHPRGQRNPLA